MGTQTDVDVGLDILEPTPIHDQLMAEYVARHARRRKPWWSWLWDTGEAS
jgi:hypothetical protein